MKKITLIALVLCALGASALFAFTALEAPAVEATATTVAVSLDQVLPGTVVDAAQNNPNCPRDIICPTVYDPVICNDGVVYSNDCVAYRECATGCTPYLPES